MAKRRKGRFANGNDVKKTNKAANSGKSKLAAKRGKLLKKKDRKLIGAWYKHESEKTRRWERESGYMELEEHSKSKGDEMAIAGAVSDEEEDEEEALPLDMIDDEDDDEELAKVDLNELGIQAPKRPRLDSNNDDASPSSAVDFEEIPRSFRDSELNLKQLLPIKNKDGSIVPQMVRVKEEAEEEGNDGEFTGTTEHRSVKVENGSVDESEKSLSTIELFVKRKKLLSEYKQRIAVLCFAIVENPQEKTQKLKELLSLASGESESVAVIRCTVQKLAIASLAEVFTDIIPGYRIRELTEAEKHQQMKSETRKIVIFEEVLLRYYKKYLQLLEKLCNRLPKKCTSTAAAESGVHRRLLLGKLAVQCLSKFVVAHPHFNFRSNILVVLTPLMSCWHEEIQEIACKSVEQLFRADRVGEATLDAVKSICRFVKNNEKVVHGRMLSCFLHLRIKEVQQKDANGKTKKDVIMSKKRKLVLSMSRKEKKMQKRLKCLEKELEEVELQDNMNTILKLHTNVMDQVFATYFRVLRRSPASKLLPEALAGLSKFAHLVNVELVDDLVVSLRQLVESQSLKPMETLHCIRTAFVILSGDGHALTIDPYCFYVTLYCLFAKMLQETNRGIQVKQFSLALECLDMMINRRRKQVSLSRVAAFTKRLCHLCLVMAEPECAATLLAVRSFFIAHPQLEILLDEEELVGGKYRADIDDPEHCNATSTTIIREMELLSVHPNATIKSMALHIRYKLPSQGRHRLPTDLLVNTSPWALVTRMATAAGGEASAASASVNSRTVVRKKLGQLCKPEDGSKMEDFSNLISTVMKLP